MSEAPWQLIAAGSARREIQNLPEKYAGAMLDLLPVIASNPKRVGKPLRFELQRCFSARRGPYRIVYRIDDESHSVFVPAVGHRADIYRPR